MKLGEDDQPGVHVQIRAAHTDSISAEHHTAYHSQQLTHPPAKPAFGAIGADRTSQFKADFCASWLARRGIRYLR